MSDLVTYFLGFIVFSFLVFILFLKITKWRAVRRKDRIWLESHYAKVGPLALVTGAAALLMALIAESSLLGLIAVLVLISGTVTTYFRSQFISLLLRDKAKIAEPASKIKED